ncbi:phosphopantetheine-binding protein [Nocardia sp. 004]|uniref:phosphopantetheine-binding protein n=1 Tax=Nocardia sp. 004 TaxID=3385978 RepID=UPI0039A0D501
MADPEIIRTVQEFIQSRILHDPEFALEESTQLLKLGILTSLSTMRLVSFIHEKFGVDVPVDEMLAENFADLTAIGALITRLELQKGDSRV